VTGALQARPCMRGGPPRVDSPASRASIGGRLASTLPPFGGGSQGSGSHSPSVPSSSDATCTDERPPRARCAGAPFAAAAIAERADPQRPVAGWISGHLDRRAKFGARGASVRSTWAWNRSRSASPQPGDPQVKSRGCRGPGRCGAVRCGAARPGRKSPRGMRAPARLSAPAAM